MTVTREELLKEFGVQDSTLRSTLKHCGLSPSLKVFDESQLGRVREARRMLSAGKSKADVAAKFGVESVKSRVDSKPAGSALKQETTARKQPADPLPVTESMTPFQLQDRSELTGEKLKITELVSLLEACGLTAELDTYSPEQVATFDAAIALYRKGKSFAEIGASFVGDTPSAYDLVDLQQLARNSLGTFNLKDVTGVLDACGISPDQDSFSNEEAKFFLAAARNYKHGAPLETCAQSISSDLDIDPAQIAEILSSNGVDAVERLSELHARADAGTAEGMYFAQLLKALTSPEAVQRRTQMVDRIGAAIVGKSRALGRQRISKILSGTPLSSASSNNSLGSAGNGSLPN